MGQPLAGLRVLELAEGVAGPYAGKLMADLGADVVKVEPPGGDRSRHHGDPAIGGRMTSLFAHLNTNKRSIVADLDTAEGADLVLRLAARSDLVLSSMTADRAEQRGLSYGSFKERRPGIVVVSLTPFGLTGPRAHWKGEEIVTFASSGVMSASGLADREPMKMGGNIGQYHAGNIAAVASLSALAVAESTGRSIHVDAAACDAQFASIDRRVTYLLYQGFTGMDPPRSHGPTISPFPTGVFPTADGYVQITTTARWIPRMLSVLGNEVLAARYAAGNPLADPDLPQLAFEGVLGWTIERTSQEAMEQAQAAGWPVTALNTLDKVLADPHLEQRRFWVDAKLGDGETVRQTGAPIRFHAGGWQAHRQAPALDADRSEILALSLAPLPATPPAAVEGARLPLDGIVVIDMTAAWAGPFGTQLLADLGATVIRIDNPAIFPTNTRGAMARPTAEMLPLLGPIFGGYPDLDPGERPWNRAAVYLAHARGKKLITLDARTDLGHDMMLRLIERADVLMENNTVDLLDRLGIGWEAAIARNPRLVMVRLPSAGFDGPYRHFLGFGSNMEALFGLTAIRGYPDLDVGSNDAAYHMDAATGGAAAFATLVALRRRERTGVGELVELAQNENMLNHIGELLLDAQRGVTTDPRMGNRHAWRAPQGVYRSLDAAPGTGGSGRVGAGGLDRWVVISVGDEVEWAGLCMAMDDPEWAADERFGSEQGRREHHDEIDAGIARWSGLLTHCEAAARCQAQGVPAAAVLTESEQRADPHLRARGLLRMNHGPDIGSQEFAGHPWKWDGPPLAWGSLGAMGDDNDEIYRGLLGVDDATWAALVAEGHIATFFRDAEGRPL